MIITFIILVAGMVVDQRRNEIAVLRSRGSSVPQLLGIALVESFLLGILALIAAIPLSLVIANFFSRTVSFLNFTGASQIKASFSWAELRFGLVALAMVTMAQVIPTFGAARNTVVTYKRERARDLKRPWWQRAWLDLLLLIPTAYGFYMMKQNGGVLILGRGSQASSGDPFQDPLLLLVPTLGSFAVTLLLLRLLPYFMSVIAWIVSKTNSVGILMAARYLARSSRAYNAPLILLVLTLSLSTFTASLAQTLDRHIHDQAYYAVGADISVKEIGALEGGQITQTAPGQSSQAGDADASEPYWVFMPVSEHLNVPGVKAAARVERVRVSVTSPAPERDADFFGVDRADFAHVAFWRKDFSQGPLGELMNKLAVDPAGVLISEDLMVSNNLHIGDTIQVAASIGSTPYRINYHVVGVLDLFPTWKPTEGPLVVGNLDYYFEQVGGEQPYLVWLKTDPQADTATVISGVNDIYQRVMYVQVTRDMLNAELERPERQGFFGLLSVGFIALGLLTVLGFLLYAVTSFGRRFIEFGMLRAIGLSTFQMALLLISELAFLFLFGMAAGTGLGVGVSNWFIPALQVGNLIAVNFPPFLVTIDWPSVFKNYLLFSLLLVASLVILIVSLIRMKVFQAIKLGEST
jgi:putative ABC transport system permease protein